MRFFRQHLPVLIVFLFIAFGTGACVHSKTKVGGRAETDVVLPPKSSKVKPELRRSPLHAGQVDPITDHTLDWNVLDSQLQTVRARLDRRFTVEGFGPFIIASNLAR